MEKNTGISKFNEIYNSLSLIEKRDLRREICEASGIEYHSFMRRLRNNSWTGFEVQGIRRILKRRGYES